MGGVDCNTGHVCMPTDGSWATGEVALAVVFVIGRAKHLASLTSNPAGSACRNLADRLGCVATGLANQRRDSHSDYVSDRVGGLRSTQRDLIMPGR